MRKVLPILLVASVAACSAASAAEPVYKGKTLGQWVKQARDRQEFFLDFHRGKSWKLQEEGFDALVEIGAPAVAPLTEMLHHDAWEVRWMAVQSLGKIGPAAKDAFAAVAETAKSDDSRDARYEAGEALIRIDRSRAVPVLVQGLKDKDHMVRFIRAVKLGELGNDAKAAVPALREALNDPDERVRKSAAHALTQIDPQVPPGPSPPTPPTPLPRKRRPTQNSKRSTRPWSPSCLHTSRRGSACCRVSSAASTCPSTSATGWRGRSTAWDFVQDDPRLPRVLLIGDSVSRGYTQAVRRALAGKANVHRAPANCGPTANSLKNIDVWLGEGKWDVIHFNFGIHDRATPIADYTGRLEQLVERMERTGAKLVRANTTPIPDLPDKKQTAASVIERNKAAAEVMTRHGIAIDDLFAAVTPHLAELQNPNDVHFNARGYDFLGRQVADSIRKALK